MPCYCRVAIEHCPQLDKPDHDSNWFCVVEPTPLLLIHPLLLYRLAGYCLREVAAEDRTLVCPPIAADRGLPNGVSEKAQMLLSDSTHITWATPSEVAQAFKPLRISERQWGWRFVRDTIRLLASHYGDEHVRILLGLMAQKSNDN